MTEPGMAMEGAAPLEIVRTIPTVAWKPADRLPHLPQPRRRPIHPQQQEGRKPSSNRTLTTEDHFSVATLRLLSGFVEGRLVKAVAQVSKSAFTYVFNRATWEPPAREATGAPDRLAASTP